MVSNVNGATQQFLADLDRIQATADRAQREISSGLSVELPSDAPDAIRGILQLRSEMAQNGQLQTNLTGVKTDLSIADASVQSAVSVLQRAITLATQGATSTATAADRTSMSQEVSSLLEELVSLSNTTSDGRYIFSGDPQSAPYQLDPTNPTGATELVTGTNTSQVQDGNGVSISVSMSAQDIFDHRTAGNTPAADNVFAAVNGLQAALASNNQSGVQASITALKQASGHLNAVLGFYGAAENRVQDALDRASQASVQQTADLSNRQDADIAAVSVQLTMAQTDQQAALAAKAKMPPTSLFNYLA